jgi:excinuclease UvrABC ATPase subunit
LQFLLDVGLDYLSLDRAAGTLSGGEAQRIRLATQIGSGLVGVLYVLDEPSIGLHQRDNKKLIDTLIRLRNLGNTLNMMKKPLGLLIGLLILDQAQVSTVVTLFLAELLKI